VTRKDLRTEDRTNTYRNRGLPPGPIANPGLASLAAALNPSKTEYLYFVSKNDGSHTFSRTLPEHNRAVEQFRRARRTRRARAAGSGYSPLPDELRFLGTSIMKTWTAPHSRRTTLSGVPSIMKTWTGTPLPDELRSLGYPL